MTTFAAPKGLMMNNIPNNKGKSEEIKSIQNIELFCLFASIAKGSFPIPSKSSKRPNARGRNDNISGGLKRQNNPIAIKSIPNVKSPFEE